MAGDENQACIHSTLFLSTYYMFKCLLHLHCETGAHAARTQSLYILTEFTDLWVTEKGTISHKRGDVTLLANGGARIRNVPQVLKSSGLLLL